MVHINLDKIQLLQKRYTSCLLNAKKNHVRTGIFTFNIELINRAPLHETGDAVNAPTVLICALLPLSCGILSARNHCNFDKLSLANFFLSFSAWRLFTQINPPNTSISPARKRTDFRRATPAPVKRLFSSALRVHRAVRPRNCVRSRVRPAIAQSSAGRGLIALRYTCCSCTPRAQDNSHPGACACRPDDFPVISLFLLNAPH